MKELTVTKKYKVIKLFLVGQTYDEIAQQVGIAKGSVVNIVDEFREGIITAPPGMSEYIDELRKLVVDLKKHDTTVAQLMTYAKLYKKIQEMGVDKEHIDQWLDICQGIAAQSVSSNQFVVAALELAAKTGEIGFSYRELLEDYEGKTKAVQLLQNEITRKTDKLNLITQQLKEEKEQATQELKTITEAIATAQETFKNQKKEIQSQLKEYMDQNQLTWQKVKAVSAILTTALGKAGLSKEEVEKIAKDIAHAGSIVIYIKQLERKKDELEPEVSQLAQKEEVYSGNIKTLEGVGQQLYDSVVKKGQEENELEGRLEQKRADLATVEKTVNGYIGDIHLAHNIIAFLVNPKILSNYEIDELVDMMLWIRKFRLGSEAKTVVDKKGNELCLCSVPKLYIETRDYNLSIEDAAERLAMYLVPVVKDKFMPRWEYDAAKLTNSILELDKKLWSLKYMR